MCVLFLCDSKISNLYNEPLPPATPPAFVLLSLFLSAITTNINGHPLGPSFRLRTPFFNFYNTCTTHSSALISYYPQNYSMDKAEDKVFFLLFSFFHFHQAFQFLFFSFYCFSKVLTFFAIFILGGSILFW